MVKATAEQKALKKEIGFLRGTAGGIVNKNNLSMAADAAYAQKKKADQKDELVNHIKRKHGEMMMREKVHQQKYLDCVAKQKA